MAIPLPDGALTDEPVELGQYASLLAPDEPAPSRTTQPEASEQPAESETDEPAGTDAGADGEPQDG